MEKTQLGINVNYFAAGIYLTGLTGNLTPVLLLIGYTLFFERNQWLRKACMRTLFIVIGFAALRTAVGLIPELFGTFDSISKIFNGEVGFPKFLTNIIVAVKSVLSVVEKGVLVFLSYTAIKYKNCTIPVMDDLVDKNM